MYYGDLTKIRQAFEKESGRVHSSTRVVQAYLPPELYQQVKEEAERQERSVSWIVTDVLKRHFEIKERGAKG